MGRKPVKNKKLPEDYPQFAFRISKADKEKILNQVDEVQRLLNTKRSVGSPFINKNDILKNAIEIGIKYLKKNGI